ncbi:hypothetical protein CCZ37_06305 [Vibrio qinghaiensis]|jgi:hypothetical protein|uniref:WD40 repeat protein n=1 Tax=Vibrio qinghaiensis TaxID=2025808 RepID=A0A223MXE3_9VIBR|nr:hypothetical protein [Vibrio qinghaiensis]ASU22219.1 hypothetical protein CCZ37_06305 [Vibrio qinghaiensis]
MKWISIIFTCIVLISTSTVQGSGIRTHQDLTQFDLPFLLGDWYLLNPNLDSSSDDFRSIKLTLESNYRFKIDIQKKNYNVDHWEGEFDASDSTLILGLNSSQPQVYQYQVNHNMLNLNGIIFTKALSNALAGVWSSKRIFGEDAIATDISQLDLVLQPDFVFMFKVSGANGNESIHKGVYYTEGDHLVLLYEDGEHDTRYTLVSDMLTLEVENGSMSAVLARVHQ